MFNDAELNYSDTPMDHLKVLHGHVFLKELDKDKALPQRLAALRSKIRALPFDYVIFDTPPALGPRIARPLLWSDIAILAVQPNLSSTTGLDDTFDAIKGVQRVNRGLAIYFR